MKKALPLLLIAVFCGASPTFAGDVGIDLDIHIGNRAPVPIIVDEPPVFLVPPALNFHVAVGVPYDMFRIDGRYYLCLDNVWYAAPAYDGPWVVLHRDRLPHGLAKRRYAEIIALRNEEYGRFKKYRNHYRWDRDHYRWDRERDHDHYRRDRDHSHWGHDNHREDRDHHREVHDDNRADRDHGHNDRDHYRRESYHPGKGEKGGHSKEKSKKLEG